MVHLQQVDPVAVVVLKGWQTQPSSVAFKTSPSLHSDVNLSTYSGMHSLFTATFLKKDYHLSKLKKGHHSMNEIRYPSGHSGRHSTIDKSALLKHEAFPPPLGSSNIINMVSTT